MKAMALLSLLALAACSDLRAEDLAPAAKPAPLTQGPAMARIDSLESNLGLEAQFNPKELTVDKHVSWTKTKNSSADAPTLEFVSGQPRTLSVELLFDLFEEKGDVYKTYISKLDQLTSIDQGLKRPPMVTFTWGSGFPVFKGVIESLGTKYTLFLPDGTPVRATVNLKMKQAEKLLSKKDTRMGEDCNTDNDCTVAGEVCRAGHCVR